MAVFSALVMKLDFYSLTLRPSLERVKISR